MIQFPETARVEWETIANAANAERELRKRIEHDTEVEREAKRLRIRHSASVIFQQELDEDQTPALEMVTLNDYRNNPTAVPTDLIDGVLKKEGLCTMLGPAGSGKSTLALQMLYSLSTGDDWLGQATKPIMGSVGVVSYDMDAAMMLDWMNGYPNMDPTKVHVVNAHKRGNPLGVPALRSQISAMWRQQAVEVVVIDSFSASFFGHDQNDAGQVQGHYRDLLRFALTEVGASAVIVIVHSTQASPSKGRGSTVHEDAPDTIVNVVADLKTGERTVTMTKYRAARGQREMDPIIISAPDVSTHLCSVDYPAMRMAGMHLPLNAGAAMFDELPDTHEPPDTDSMMDMEDL